MADLKELRLLTGGGAAACVANSTWWLQPILMQQFVSGKGWTDTSAGLMLSGEVMALALASALATAWLRRDTPLRRVANAAILTTMLASLATLWVQDHYGALLAVRIVAGIGAGITLTVSNTVGAMSRSPDAMFARFGLVNVIYGVLLMWALPSFSGLWHDGGSFELMLAALFLLLPLANLMPRTAEPAPSAQDEPPPARRQGSVRLAALAVSTFAFGLCSGVMWAYYAIIGTQAGLSGGEVESAIGMAIFSAGAATCLVAAAGTRFGRIAPVALGLLAMLLAVVVLSRHPGPQAFRWAVCVNIAAVYCLLPYFLGAATAEDPRRGAAYVGSAFFFAGGASPLVGGWLVETVGIGTLGFGVALVLIPIALQFIQLERRDAATVRAGITVG